MKPSLRIYFLIWAGASALHLSAEITLVVFGGYLVFEWLDDWLNKKRRKAKIDAIEYEVFGWKPDGENPEYENKGDLTRLRLTDRDQIIVTRVAELLRQVT